MNCDLCKKNDKKHIELGFCKNKQYEKDRNDFMRNLNHQFCQYYNKELYDEYGDSEIFKLCLISESELNKFCGIKK